MADVLDRKAAREWLLAYEIGSVEAVSLGAYAGINLPLALAELDAADARIAALEAERDSYRRDYASLEDGYESMRRERDAALADLRECMRKLEPYVTGKHCFPCTNHAHNQAYGSAAALLTRLRAAYPELEKEAENASKL